MPRLYFTRLVGTGTQDDPFRSVISDLFDVRVRRIADLRMRRDRLEGWALWLAYVDDAQHATLVASADIEHLDVPQDPGAVIETGGVSALLESMDIPVDDLPANATVVEVLNYVSRRAQIRGWAKGDDLSVSERTNPGKRQKLQNRLTPHGLTVAASTEARSVILDMMRQSARWPIWRREQLL